MAPSFDEFLKKRQAENADTVTVRSGVLSYDEFASARAAGVSFDDLAGYGRETYTAPTTWEAAQQQTESAKRSLVAYDQDGKVSAWQTALNMAQDAKAYNRARSLATGDETEETIALRDERKKLIEERNRTHVSAYDIPAAQKRQELQDRIDEIDRQLDVWQRSKLPQTAEEASALYGEEMVEVPWMSKLLGRPVYNSAKGEQTGKDLLRYIGNATLMAHGVATAEQERQQAEIGGRLHDAATSAWKEMRSTPSFFKEKLTSLPEPTGDETVDNWHKDTRTNAEAARMIAETYGIPTYALDGSATRENADAYTQRYEDMEFGEKLGANAGMAAAGYGLDITNAALAGWNTLSGGRLGEEGGKASSIFQAANFLQNAGSGLTAQAYSSMRESANWLEKLILDLEKTGVEQVLDRTLGAGNGLVPMGIRVFGSGAQESEDRGEDWKKQAGTGLARAAIELGTEALSGVGGSWRGTGYGESFLNAVDKWVASKTGSELLGTLANAYGGEALEEMIADILNPLADRIFGIGEATGRGQDRTFMQQLGDFLTDVWGDGQILYDGLLGGLAGIGGGVTAQIGYSAGARNLAVDVATYKAAQRIAGSNSLKAKFEKLTGVKLDADKETATIQLAAYLANVTESSGGTLDARQAETNLFNGKTTGTEKNSATLAATGAPMPTAQETGVQYVQQVISNMDVPEAAQRVLMDGLEIGDADPQTYAHGIQEAFRLGEMGLTYEQAVENSTQSDNLTREQFQHAWQIGAQKSGNAATAETPTVSRRGVPEYDSIESFSREFTSPEKVTEIFDQTPDADVNEFAAGFRAAYDMGQSGVSANYLTEANVPALTTQQAQAAYQLGQTDAETKAVTRDTATAQKQKSGGNQARVRGTVRGEGVTIADLRRSFNDSQNTAYRLLTRYADTTGVNIVLYNSQADSNTGLFPSTQGRFQWKDDTIYVDINSGLFSNKDVSGLGNYTMLRTFAHEFTHFIEKWNAGQYNEFREFVFYTIEQRGENVHDMIEQKQSLDESGQMTYEQASREVVADAMMDILPDSTLVQQLAEEHPNVFRTILRKLREFAARLKQYYRGISGSIREAQALKENGAYLDSIVKMWDQIAKGAVENYQRANGEILVDQPVKPDNLQRRSKANVQESAKGARSEQPETRRAGMDFFRTVEETPEDAQDVRQQAGVQRVQPASRARFAGNDLTSQAEAGPDIRQQPGVQRVAPAGRERFAPNDFTSRAEAGPDMKGMVPRAAERATESETVEEVIEAAEESTEPLEPVPPTEQTEAAKQRLKKGVQTPVQISNTEAIRQGLFRKELTPDNITLTGTVRGLNAEQRAVIIRELLEAHYAGKKEASISVPYDGKFTLSTETEAVAYVIGALKAKVTQDVLFDRKLDAHLRKANPPSTFKLKGNWYISNGFDIIPITDDAAEYAQSNDGYKARITEMQKALESALDDDYEPLETMPTEITLSNGSQYYRFEIDGKKVFFNKDSLDYLDGGRIGYKRMDITWLSGKTQSMDFIRAVDEDGEVVGYVLATTINPAMRVTKEIPGKLKSFKPGKAKKATKTTPAPAKAEPTPAPTRTTEAQEKTAEAKRETKSRFPLQEWKKGTPSQKAAYRILTEYLRTGKGLPSKDLYAICDEAFGGTQAEGAYNRKDAYDAMELAVNRYLLEAMKYYNTGTIDNAAKGVEKALEIVNRLPTQNVRTKEQLEYQQFSTPPSIAYIAAWAANINAQDHVLEPSAGIGGLAAFAKAWGAEVTVNELSKRRLEVLRAMGFDHIFNENAEHIHDILPDDIRPTAVIMNPPFSSTAGRTTTNKTSNAEAHINSALDRLAENGRLVAILGRGMADDKYGKYWDRLRKEYTIRANIGIDGENYKKYGTTFDVQIVVIDKVGPQGEARTFTGSYKNLVDAIKALEGTRNDRSAEVERISPVESNPESAAQPAEEQPVSPAMAEANPADSGGTESGDRIDAGRGGESGNADVQRAERGAEPVPDAGARERGAVEQQRPDKKKSGSRKTVEQSEGLRSDARTDRTAANVQGQSEQQRRGSQSEPARGGQVSADPVTDDGVYTGYRAPDIPIKGSKPHPAVLVESAAMGAVEMPKATYTPKLPDSITKTGALSTEQLVSVTYAGQAHEQKLPNGERRGFFIGDGTGVGKGRTISGIIFDNFEQGRKKAIWISENTKLLPDAIRDWTDISGRGKEDIKDLSTVKLGAKIEKPEGIVFTSYDTVRTKKGNLSRIDQLVDWFGKDFDGVIAFDEAHNMGNLLGKTGARGKSPGSQKAIAAVELQKRLPNARVIYVSATAATEVSGLAFASRLGLWGKGTAFTDVNDFVSKIGSAGLSAMELVVRDMKSMGMYVARSISYNGVEYDTVQHDLDPVQKQIYNTMSRAWQNTMRSVEQSLVDTGAQHNSQAKQNAIGQYFSAIQRFYNQVLTSMSMPSVIADMKRQLADGKSCVLQIVNTNQAEADRQIADIKANNGELDDMDLTPRGTLIDYLMKCYPVTKFEEYEDEDGNLRSRPVTNSKGEPVVDKKAVAKRDALIDEVNQMSIPDGPLEMLFDAFGTENVSEITGRTRRVVPRKQADGSIKRVEESRTKSSRVADISAFQNGDKRILVFSAAGGTGASYHADLRAKNQQQRVHYVLQPGWEASKAVQGFGRTHRSNEASAPIYKLVTTDIKGQKRFTSTIARRLDQLGALTKGQRDTGSGMFGASDNLETDLARDSLREFYYRLGKNKLEGINGRDVLQKLGLLEKFTGEYGEFKMNDTVARDISKFLNRILALEVDEQNRVFDAFISIYEAEMDAAIQAGTLDRGMENIKADKIEIVDDKVIHEQKGTGAATHYVQAKVYTKPKLITTVAEAEGLRGGFQGVYRTKDGAIRAVYRIADKTTEWGAVTKQFKLQSPNRSKSSVWQERTLDSNAELLPKSEWQKAWDEEISKQPEFNEDVKHMLTGSLLPIWDALPEEGNTKVQRLITDDGKAYLGRIISPEQIDNVLRRFDVNRTKETFTGKTLMQKAAASNVVFNLTYQRAKIHRSRVSGEWRLEYEQPFNAFAVQQQYPDMMMERINYQNRFFIPMNEKGEALLDKLLEANPVSNVVERGEDIVQYSRRPRPETSSAAETEAVQNDFSADGDENRVQFSRRVRDPETLKFLNDQVARGEVVHTYKTFLELEVNGEKKLYPPMASRQKADDGTLKMANAMAVGEWEESVGNPNSKNIFYEINKKGEKVWKYNLNKEDSSRPVGAAYDPYQHSSDVVLNDQFEKASQRPNLVTYECLIPASELTSGYHYSEARADGEVVTAALPVGKHPWKKGTVASGLKKTNRSVFLTRWLMPFRRLENSEVAQMYKEIVDREDQEVEIPFNVVPPGLQAELEKIGVPINYDGSPSYQRWSRNNPEDFPKGKPIVQNSTRRQSISDRDVLRMAAEEINVDSLTPGEQDALRIFNERLDRLQEAQDQRAELGIQYKEQQFTKGGSRAEAEKIHNRMGVLDERINRLENDLLALENRDVLKSVLKKARSVVETAERTRGAEKLKQYRQQRKEAEATRKYRNRVIAEAETLRQWLMKPSNKDVRKHIPAEMQKTVADFLASINMMSKTALRSDGAKTTKADDTYLRNMRRMLDAIKENIDTQGLYSGFADLHPDFIPTFEGLIRKTEDYIRSKSGNYVINQMSAAELRDLSLTLRELRRYITTINEFHNNAMFQHADEAGESSIEHLSELKTSDKSNGAYKFMRFDYMRPSYVFEHFGKGGQSIEHEFRDGQATQARLANQIIDFAKDTYKGNEVKAWSEDVKTFTLSGGEEISLPVTHIMSLYCLSKREQAKTHIYGDGIRVANFKADGKARADTGHIVTLEDVQRMVQTLTPRQIAVADALQKFMSTECAKWGNYVSMRRFDVEQFGEENYFPINSDGRYLPATADESPDNAGLYALLNMGFTKELKENAKNRIILYNIFDVFSNHAASMTQYRSFALPMLDALKWFNYKSDGAGTAIKTRRENMGLSRGELAELTDIDEKTIKKYEEKKVFSVSAKEAAALAAALKCSVKDINKGTSVRDQLSRAYGSPLDERIGSGAKGYAESFVINLLKAYNGTAAQGDPYDSVPLKMLHRFNGAQIAFNLRVVIQQPTAITRAAMILSPAKLSKGLGMSAVQMRKLADEMEQHSGIAAWKRLGFYDTNISRGLTDLIKQNPTVHDQVMDVGTKGAEAADRFTWAAMWYAAKDSVNRSSYSSEEAYMKAVTELFEEVIYKTQVVDSLLTKSEFLRSKGGLARQLGSFMSEPSATMSMLADAHYKYTDDLQRGMSRSEAWRRNGGNIAKTAAVYAVGQVILSAMQAVMDAWRDDDEYDSENWLNNYLQKYVNAFKGNVVEELAPFGKIPIVSELYEIIKGWMDYAGVFEKIGLDLYGNDISSGLSMYMKYIDKAMKIVIGKVTGDKSYANYTNYGVVYNLIRGVSNLSGIPFGTAWRELEDIWNNTVGYFVPNMKLKTYESSIDREYENKVRQTGLSKNAFEQILADADTSGNGSLTQDELGKQLTSEIRLGKITEEQADAIWKTKWNSAKSKTFAKWQSENGSGAPSAKAAEPASASASTRTPFTPEAAPAGVSDYEGFRSAAPLYGSEKKQAAYGVWESQLSDSMSFDRFTEILVNADSDGNDSLKQDELGYALRSAINRGELSYGQASAVWNTQGWARSFDYWSGRH